MTSRLHGTPCLPPPAAREMDARGYKPMPWDEERRKLVLRVFRDLKARWKFDPEPDRVWDDARLFTTFSGKRAFQGNCNAWAPELRRRLEAVGLPMSAMRLMVCKRAGEGHLVLALDTEAGVYVLCNIAGCWPLDSEEWASYEWIAWEAPGRAWESLEPVEPVTLDRVLAKADPSPGPGPTG